MGQKRRRVPQRTHQRLGPPRACTLRTNAVHFERSTSAASLSRMTSNGSANRFASLPQHLA
eukprot:5520015-Alexandrium_andersonii.AAC.1